MCCSSSPSMVSIIPSPPPPSPPPSCWTTVLTPTPPFPPSFFFRTSASFLMMYTKHLLYSSSSSSLLAKTRIKLSMSFLLTEITTTVTPSFTNAIAVRVDFPLSMLSMTTSREETCLTTVVPKSNCADGGCESTKGCRVCRAASSASSPPPSAPSPTPSPQAHSSAFSRTTQVVCALDATGCVESNPIVPNGYSARPFYHSATFSLAGAARALARRLCACPSCSYSSSPPPPPPSPPPPLPRLLPLLLLTRRRRRRGRWATCCPHRGRSQ